MSNGSGSTPWKALAPSRESLERTALTLAIATSGGSIFWAIGMPLPFLTGSATATAVAAMMRKKLEVVLPLRMASLVLIGALLGSAVTPEALALLPRWPLTIAGLACAIFTTMAVGACYLERIHGYDRATARLSSTPGAITQVMALALESNADPRRVSIIQITRLAAILLLLPAAAALLGIQMSATINRPDAQVMTLQVILVLACAAAGAWLFTQMRSPAPLIVGSMVAVAIIFGTGMVHTALPEWLLTIALVVIGSMIGINFGGTDLTMLADTVAAACGSLAVCSLVALAWAFPLALLLGLSPIQVWLAYAPGGVEISAIMAMSLGLDVAFVSSHHVIRVVILNLCLVWWLRLGRAATEAEGKNHTQIDGRYD